MITDGDTISVTLTKADETGDFYGTMRLVASGEILIVTPEPLRFLIFPVSRGEPQGGESGQEPFQEPVAEGTGTTFVGWVKPTDGEDFTTVGFTHLPGEPASRESLRTENGRRTPHSRGGRPQGVGPGGEGKGPASAECDATLVRFDRGLSLNLGFAAFDRVRGVVSVDLHSPATSEAANGSLMRLNSFP